MSYQVLARKWRPQTFREMVGQEHVLRALINALDHGNLHHAYLFTGTRGVGKTTIARILAKCLNCESGVSSEPCSQCGACTEISSGRFIDLIEVDAASRTKVEDTRELLDNVQYAPTSGRYKVYLIDEVHMLSNHSFNALLKTLEEPPPHVIFLLATTDPQKLPITILSRCLQFNLKNMPPERIVHHLQMVLDKEMISYEEQALWQLARAAEGSMRDALTLTDQAIAYGAQSIALADVTVMLGSIDQHQVHRILSHLVRGNARELLLSVEEMAEYSPDYQAVLASLISVMHRVAVAQLIPDLEDNSEGDWSQVLELAQQMTGEDVQLFYQIGLMGQKDLAMTPDIRQGFEMVLLRMLAFKPEALVNPPVTPLKPSSNSPAPGSTGSAAGETGSKPAVKAQLQNVQQNNGVISQKKLAESSVQHQTFNQTQQFNQTQSFNEQQAGSVSSLAATVTESGLESVAVAQNSSSTIIPELPTDTTDKPMGRLESPDGIATQFSDKTVPEFSSYASQDRGGQAAEENPLDKKLVEQRSTEKPVNNNGRNISQSATQLTNNIDANKSDKNVGDIRGNCSLSCHTDWLELFQYLALVGMTRSILAHCVFAKRDQDHYYFLIGNEDAAFLDRDHEQQLTDALSELLQRKVSVTITIGDYEAGKESPASRDSRLCQEKQERAIEAFQSNDNVLAIVEQFSATIDVASITPLS